jgi:hypothetical protein
MFIYFPFHPPCEELSVDQKIGNRIVASMAAPGRQ